MKSKKRQDQKPHMPNYYCQYHNLDNLKYLPGAGFWDGTPLTQFDTTGLEMSSISTTKVVPVETDDIIFLIVGYTNGRTKEYVLWSYGNIVGMEDNRDETGWFDIFCGEQSVVLNPPVELTGDDFAEFRRQMGNFGLGLQKISTRPFLKNLLELTGLLGLERTDLRLSLPSSSDVTPENTAEVIEKDRQLRKTQVFDRGGQGNFREELLLAYDGRCAVTKCSIADVLEAAHILQVAQRGADSIPNGLLLRSDIHLLFDRDLLKIHPETLIVHIVEKLRDTEYGRFHLQKIQVPKHNSHHPSQQALRLRWDSSSK
ncbi:MAG: HNH endonuclease [Planctomycetaceae bacterium]|nr:HNH endonuclease [Planctomycetaceae bacterium]